MPNLAINIIMTYQEEIQALRDTQSMLIEAGVTLQNLQERVLKKTVSIEEAIAAARLLTGQDLQPKFTEDFLRFKEDCSEVFRNEMHFNSGYDLIPGVQFTYHPSSDVDVNFLYHLYTQFKSRDYSSPKDLRAIMEDILRGKSLLELGCGPGFGLKVFQDLGARVVGVELKEAYKGRIPSLDIRYGSAEDLEALIPHEQFDFVYSKDFLSQTVIDTDTAIEIAVAVFRVTKPEGYGVHVIHSEKLNPQLREFMGWLGAVLRGADLREWKRRYDAIPDDEKDYHSFSNLPSLTKEMIGGIGFEVLKYGIQNEDLVIITKRNF